MTFKSQLVSSETISWLFLWIYFIFFNCNCTQFAKGRLDNEIICLITKFYISRPVFLIPALI